MRIAVLGATGVLGRHVVPRLIERGHTVRAAVRDSARGAALAAAGAELVRADILDRATLPPLLAGCDAALHLATAVPKPGQPLDWTLNDSIRREGTALLLDAARRERTRRIVAQSVAMLHGGSGDAWVTEDTPLPPTDPLLRSAEELEAQVLASGLDVCILRGGLFYGPGTRRAEAWREAARAGTLRLPGDGTGYVSLIHVADMARAVVAATEARGPDLFLVTDNAPVTMGELLAFVARHAGAPPPRPGGPVWPGSFRVSNARLRTVLGVEPAYPGYRSGWA